MIPDASLPADLASLFRPGDEVGRSLSVALPPGRAVVSPEREDGRPVYWLSDGPAPHGLWERLRQAHTTSGLWPLLLRGEEYDPAQPWESGETYPDDDADPAAHDPVALMALWWQNNTVIDEADDMLSPEERRAVTAPYGDGWPGLAPTPPVEDDPSARADGYADYLLHQNPAMRLGLIAAGRGADALTVAGWAGPVNYTGDTAEISAVLRSWEDRFGVRVVGLEGVATLMVSVATPPAGLDEALAVAAEHFAFCPDNIWQGRKPYTLAAYAEGLIGMHSWTFWWD